MEENKRRQQESIESREELLRELEEVQRMTAREKSEEARLRRAREEEIQAQVGIRKQAFVSPFIPSPLPFPSSFFLHSIPLSIPLFPLPPPFNPPLSFLVPPSLLHSIFIFYSLSFSHPFPLTPFGQ